MGDMEDHIFSIHLSQLLPAVWYKTSPLLTLMLTLTDETTALLFNKAAMSMATHSLLPSIRMATLK